MTATAKTTKTASKAKKPAVKKASTTQIANQNEAEMLTLMRTLPPTDRVTMLTAARLMLMSKDHTPGNVIRELIRKIRATPALAGDPITLALLLRCVAHGFDSNPQAVAPAAS